jgi:hypothetical protein
LDIRNGRKVLEKEVNKTQALVAFIFDVRKGGWILE